MPIKDRDYELTADLLGQYRDAALANAQSLLEEAALLLAHGHLARAYFLSASSIEEAGKAVQAFEGLGRNLRDPAVTHRLKLLFEDHSQKVTYAFSPWLQAAPNLREEVMDFVNIMVNLGFGREASMYTDIHAERRMVTTPQSQISQRSAADCVRLAGTVLSYVGPHVRQAKPKTTTRVQDAFFALKPALFQKMANTGDFWEYYISRMESGDMGLESAVTDYNQHYLSKGVAFKPTSNPSNDADA
ncbi:AbiV family abortive infection protein [Ideonella sp. DXS29W]|uniref:AbiV family abortive infection protein n=1 Tax=Ideonella lacteola TaxID=2984193 RepID=A0ABU9BYB7_9BURK